MDCVATLRTLTVVFGLSLAIVSPAAAQIYSWHDAGGVLVLSNRPSPGRGDMQTFAVPVSPGLRATAAMPASDKSRQYDRTIEQQARRHGLSPDLVRAVIQVESAFNPKAVSSKGAMGLMQLMPATAQEFGVKNPFHPDQNIAAGVAYLRELLNRYDNKVDLALAAYNAGPANVEKYGDVPPFSETRSYVKRVTASSGPASPPVRIFKWTETVDGRIVTRYSNSPPESGPFEIVGARR